MRRACVNLALIITIFLFTFVRVIVLLVLGKLGLFALLFLLKELLARCQTALWLSS